MRPWHHNMLIILALLTACTSYDSPASMAEGAAAQPEALGAALKVQLHWGGGDSTDVARNWDGQLHLDCGRITDVRFLDLEIADGDGVAPHRRDANGTTLHWRSLVRGDVDGIEATILPCLGEPGSTLDVRTPARRWTARLAWSQDDFVSLPVGTRHEHLDIRIHTLHEPPSATSVTSQGAADATTARSGAALSDRRAVAGD